MIIITFGTFDLLHVGHVRILEKASKYKGPNGKLIVGVSSDRLNFEKKNRYPIYSQQERVEIMNSIKHLKITINYLRQDY